MPSATVIGISGPTIGGTLIDYQRQKPLAFARSDTVDTTDPALGVKTLAQSNVGATVTYVELDGLAKRVRFS